MDPSSCWRDLGRILDLHDLVAAGDYLVTGNEGAPALASPAQIHEEAHRAVGRGAPRLREAAALIRVGARSRPESLTRVALALAGVEEPQLNPELVLPRRVAYPDLYWERFRVAVEYQGGYHADPAQWARDVRRSEEFADAGIDVLQLLAADLFGPRAAAVARISARLISHGWTPPRGFDPTRMVRLTP